MQTNAKPQHRNESEPWIADAPYSKMLAEYEQAAELLVSRIKVLRGELKEMLANKNGTAASAKAQTLLEQRILLLRMEYAEIRETMKTLRIYAEKEAK
ncbi:MAG: hypothetical protein IKI58_10980 [Oscillospiraceae bacterium]|nr:hypothetical protein [Oscillospiraceae bacterium]